MGELDLTLTESEYVTNMSGSTSFVISDSGRMRIQTKQTQSDDLYTVLDKSCPEGKEWSVIINVNISEIDA
jgi:hypothetical protein